jgi:MFS family permease
MHHRFAAVEISPASLKSVAVTYVLSGGVFAAILGPTLAKYSSQILLAHYTGCFLAMGILGIFSWVVLSQVSFPPLEQAVEQIGIDDRPPPRPLRVIISQPLFILSCSVATIAHTVMVMIMSNCGLSMSDDYSLGAASLVLEMHFLAMFSPGFISAMLINHHGPFKISMAGAFIFALSSFFFAFGADLWNYYGGMILLGIAWNLSYSSATVMLTGCYEVMSDRHWHSSVDRLMKPLTFKP